MEITRFQCCTCRFNLALSRFRSRSTRRARVIARPFTPHGASLTRRGVVASADASTARAMSAPQMTLARARAATPPPPRSDSAPGTAPHLARNRPRVRSRLSRAPTKSRRDRFVPSRASSAAGGDEEAADGDAADAPTATASKDEDQPAPSWWNPAGRIGHEWNAHVRRDERTEYGYLEHVSDPVTLFEKESKLNGVVRVVSHGPWRSLRFNQIEQGLTFTHENGDGDAFGKSDGDADEDVLGYLYLRCMTCVAAVMLRMDGANCLLDGSHASAPRVICVGLGSGAMPAFIARKFPRVIVEVVEIDPVVLEAVREHHGLDVKRRGAAMGASKLWGGDAGTGPGLGVVMGDAETFMRAAADAVESGDAPPASAIFLDAFDGFGDVPAHLLTPDFLTHCDRALAPGGVVVANMFNGVLGSDVRKSVGKFAVALTKEIGPTTSWLVETPCNVVLAARKRPAGVDAETEIRFTRKEIKAAAEEITKMKLFDWSESVGHHVRRAFWVETDGGTKRAFREVPAGLSLNPLSKFVERMGTVMPPEWDEDNNPGYNMDVPRRPTPMDQRGEAAAKVGAGEKDEEEDASSEK